MRNDTRTAFNRYMDRVAHLSGVNSAREQFTPTDSVQQTLETKIMESSAFLQAINTVPVDELKGEKLGLGAPGPLAKRTDVSSNDRTPTAVGDLDDNAYECQSTEFDTGISWSKLDAWAKFPDFQTRIRDTIVRQQALDRIMIGLNGTSADTPTTKNDLSDVNIGWLQKYRDNAADRVMDDLTNSEVQVGPSGDYENLDALVFDAVNELIDPVFQDAPGLVAICGRKLLSDKYLPQINQYEQPTEQRALDLVISAKRMGGLFANAVPYFPDDSILITTLDNLSLYWQRGSRRRYMQDNPKRKRIENYESSNDAYVVEDYRSGCLIENITLGDFS